MPNSSVSLVRLPLLHLFLGETSQRITRLVQVETIGLLAHGSLQVSAAVFGCTQRGFQCSTIDVIVAQRLNGTQGLF